MEINPNNIFTQKELQALSSIVQVGEETYRELVNMKNPMFVHPYFNDTRGRLRTKLVQMQCEIESHSPDFPFTLVQRKFQYNQVVPELRTKNVIIHVARSVSPEHLPYKSKYKIDLSNNNHKIQRQLIMDFSKNPPYGEEPFYAILAFGGRHESFSVIQFPEPGYESIAESIILPKLFIDDKADNENSFKRKKAVLKKEFIAHIKTEEIS